MRGFLPVLFLTAVAANAQPPTDTVPPTALSIAQMAPIFTAEAGAPRQPFAADSLSYGRWLTEEAPSLPVPELEGSRQTQFARAFLRDYLWSHPRQIRFLSWTLPEPPTLKPLPDKTEDVLIADTPVEIAEELPPAPLEEVRRTNWLHTFDGNIQFSQAYLSPNWYQGGSNNLSLLTSLLWNVKLNEVYHPNQLLESSLSYKLGLYSTPSDQYHKYSISEDLFQYNFKYGIRARKSWFYSVQLAFKTQFINNYGENSQTRKAAFLSPGELNIGLGMTYAWTEKKKRAKFNMSLSPVSYNLKTCIDRLVDPTQFSIAAGKKSKSTVGSTLECTGEWTIAGNILWRTRLYAFTDYHDVQGDWENTINFTINRFLSTQIYVHLRYDTATEAAQGRWRHWMLKEILSFGFHYAFSTK